MGNSIITKILTEKQQHVYLGPILNVQYAHYFFHIKGILEINKNPWQLVNMQFILKCAILVA